MVSANYIIQGRQVVWSPSFRRDFYDDEIQMLSMFMMQLDEYYLDPYGQDVQVWTPDPMGVVSVKSFYNHMVGGSCVMNDRYFWRIPVPLRVLAFCWVVGCIKFLLLTTFRIIITF